MMKIINKVAGYRAMLGMNQKEMADFLDITPQSYNMKENKKRSFTDNEKLKIKNLLLDHFDEITIDDIFF